MTRQLGCLQRASGRFLAGHGVARDMHQLCKQLLAANLRCGADLGAPKEVRMVWWGFRALKTPERAFSLPTRSRRLAHLPAWCICCANGVQTVWKWCAHTGQTLDIRPAF